ncbi:methyl-accepting transducer domain-containing protein [Pseudoscourfieldia marina]
MQVSQKRVCATHAHGHGQHKARLVRRAALHNQHTQETGTEHQQRDGDERRRGRRELIGLGLLTATLVGNTQQARAERMLARDLRAESDEKFAKLRGQNRKGTTRVQAAPATSQPPPASTRSSASEQPERENVPLSLLNSVGIVASGSLAALYLTSREKTESAESALQAEKISARKAAEDAKEAMREKEEAMKAKDEEQKVKIEAEVQARNAAESAYQA